MKQGFVICPRCLLPRRVDQFVHIAGVAFGRCAPCRAKLRAAGAERARGQYP